MGRKPKPDDERMDSELRIRLTEEDRELLDAAAQAALNGKPAQGRGVTSTWARGVLLKAAARVKQQRRS